MLTREPGQDDWRDDFAPPLYGKKFVGIIFFQLKYAKFISFIPGRLCFMKKNRPAKIRKMFNINTKWFLVYLLVRVKSQQTSRPASNVKKP